MSLTVIKDNAERPPRISVICAAYNGQAFLPETIRSLIAQKKSQYEVVVVDDASTDDTAAVLSAVQDTRFKFVKNQTNQRLVYTRNRAIELSVGQYIAVTDQDDLSDPRRLQLQSSILDRYPDVSAVYSFVKAIDEYGLPTQGLPDWHYSGEAARAGLLFHNFVTHSSLMFRRSCAPETVYATDYPLCEDYNLLVHLADQGKGLHLIKKRLVGYRYHATNHSKAASGEMSSLSRELRAKLLARLGLKPSPSELRLHDAFEAPVHEPTLQLLRSLRDWALHLKEANLKASYVKPNVFDLVLSNEWLTLSNRFSALGQEAWREYLRGPSASIFRFGREIPGLAKFWVKTHRKIGL